MFTQALRARRVPSYLLGLVLAFSAVGLQAAEGTAASPIAAPAQPVAVAQATGNSKTVVEAAAACTKHCADSWGNSQTCVAQAGIFGKYTCVTKDKLCSTPCQ